MTQEQEQEQQQQETAKADLLTTKLRDYTREIHDTSDKLVNAQLVVALTNKAYYTEAISLFYLIYFAIENGIKLNKDHELIKPIHDKVGNIYYYYCYCYCWWQCCYFYYYDTHAHYNKFI